MELQGPTWPPKFVRDAWSWTVTGNAKLQTFASLKDVWRSHSLGTVPPWTPPWPSVTLRMSSWATAWRLRTGHPRSWRRELLWEEGDPETHKCAFQRRGRPVCTTGWWRDKDMGTFWAWFELVAFGKSREVLYLLGEAGPWAGVLSAPPRLEPRW